MEPHDTVPRLERVFTGIIAVAALFVGWFGWARPAKLDGAFTWADIPPLHARFVASLYLFGAVYTGSCALARRWSQTRPVLVGIAIFTTMMIVLTALNREAFDLDLGPVQGWVASYTIYPPMAWALAVLYRNRGRTPSEGPSLPSPLRWLALAFAVVLGAIGLALLFFREAMVAVWPWKVTNGLAQFYAGPFLAMAWVMGTTARCRSLTDTLMAWPAFVTIAVSTIAASLVHRALFDGGVATWLWFGGWCALGVVAAGGAATSFGLRAGASAHPRGTLTPHP